MAAAIMTDDDKEEVASKRVGVGVAFFFFWIFASRLRGGRRSEDDEVPGLTCWRIFDVLVGF